MGNSPSILLSLGGAITTDSARTGGRIRGGIPERNREVHPAPLSICHNSRPRA